MIESRARNALQERCFKTIEASGAGLPTFARRVSIPKHTLWAWLHGVQATLRVNALDKLAHALAIPYEQALTESGGKTVENTYELRAEARRHALSQPRFCRGCGNTVMVRLKGWARWKACSMECRRKSARQHLTPRNTLQGLCLEFMDAAEKPLSIAAFCQLLQVDDGAVRQWFHKDKKALSVATLEKMGALLGISAEQAIAFAGGVTGEQRRVEHARSLALRGPEAIKEAGRRSGIVRKAKAADRRARGEPSRRPVKRAGSSLPANFIADAQSIAGRIRRAFYGRMNGNPSPSRAVRRQWAKEVGDRLGWPASAVLGVWDEHVRARRLRHGKARRGPRLSIQRDQIHSLVAELRAGWPKTPSGRLSLRHRGFWDYAARMVDERFETHFSGPSLYESERRYRQRRGLGPLNAEDATTPT